MFDRPSGSPDAPRSGALRGFGRELLTGWLHLAVLWAFAFVKPLFDVLADSPEFFVARGNTSGDILLLAFGVILVPPTLLVAIEALLIPVPALRRVLHLVFVGTLTAAFVLQVLTDASDGSGRILIPIAVVLGLAGAIAYRRTRLVPTTLTVLSPAPAVLLLLFLVVSPVSKLVFPQALEISAASNGSFAADTPVVFVTFDEFFGGSLMNREHEIDASRYPNFAALAREATWYRNATTVAADTTEAVPAMLTGQYPKKGQLPIASDHPGNLFALLGTRYSLNVTEAATALCPEQLCGEPLRQAATGKRRRELISDLSVVSLHLLLPKDLGSDLPPVDRTFGDFRGHGLDRPPAARQNGSGGGGSGFNEFFHLAGALTGRASQFGRFLASLKPDLAPPPLDFFHSPLPHIPWQYLPSGQQYAIAGPELPGLQEARWVRNPTVVQQAQQRYLLQVGYVDRLVGLLMKRLRAVGLWDRALVVVTADHGVSFQPGVYRRGFDPERNLGEIANVPLFIKVPGQRDGEVDDSIVRSIDIVPTVADYLGARLGWDADGDSIRSGPKRSARSRLPIETKVAGLGSHWNTDTFTFADFERSRDAAVERMAALFGDSGQKGVYAFGADKDLVGRRLADLAIPARSQAAERAVIDRPDLLRMVDRSQGLVPTFVTGQLTGGVPGERLALAVNGRIRAVTSSFQASGGIRFAAMVPLASLQSGANEVEVVRISGGPDARRLASLGGVGRKAFKLTGRGDEQVIRSPSGSRIEIRRGAVKGYVDRVTEEGTIQGWAVGTANRRPADWVLVFAGNRFLASVRPSVFRKDVAAIFGKSAATAGYQVSAEAAKGSFRPGTLHVFGVAGSRASELPQLH